MLAFGIKPTPFHFGLLLNITQHCGLGSPNSLQDLLFPPQPQQFLLDEQENKDNEVKVHRGPSFLSSINTYDEKLPQLISTSNDSTAAKSENQQLISTTTSSDITDHQESSSSSEVSSEWWQDPDDVRKGQLLKNHLRPFSNASILKPNMSYEEPNLVGLRMPNSPAERLMLLGGIPGVLKHMQESNVLPNNIIFNSFLHVRKISSWKQYQ
jgi:hypothetical protein